MLIAEWTDGGPRRHRPWSRGCPEAAPPVRSGSRRQRQCTSY